MRLLSNLLKDSLQRAKILPQVEATLIMAQFDKVARDKWGVQAASKMEPQYFKNGVLTVKVPSGVYAQEIKLREIEVLAVLNKLLNNKIVQSIRCLV